VVKAVETFAGVPSSLGSGSVPGGPHADASNPHGSSPEALNPSSSLLLSGLELSDTQVYEPQIRALLGTAPHFCEVVVLKLNPHADHVRGATGVEEEPPERLLHLALLHDRSAPPELDCLICAIFASE